MTAGRGRINSPCQISRLGCAIGTQNPPGLPLWRNPVESVTHPCLSILVRVSNSREHALGSIWDLISSTSCSPLPISFFIGLLLNFSYAAVRTSFLRRGFGNANVNVGTQPCQGFNPPQRPSDCDLSVRMHAETRYLVDCNL